MVNCWFRPLLVFPVLQTVLFLFVVRADDGCYLKYNAFVEFSSIVIPGHHNELKAEPFPPLGKFPLAVFVEEKERDMPSLRKAITRGFGDERRRDRGRGMATLKRCEWKPRRDRGGLGIVVIGETRGEEKRSFGKEDGQTPMVRNEGY
jgi:hypothetical protein